MSNFSAYYEEVVANLTWYQLNSDFKDPMYQYMNKLYFELNAQIKLPLLPSSNYNTVDEYLVNVRNEILRYGSYECSAPGKTAYMDSWLSCFIFQLPFFLEKIQIGFIGFAFVIPIMAISIFGGIKESYRWFILNQAIWDAFLCYDYICAKPTLLGWSNLYSKQNTCFYREIITESNTIFLVKSGFRGLLRNASFIPVFHLALSRFLAMYFPRFYKKFTKNGYKIFIFIVLFYLLCLVIFAAPFWVVMTSLYSQVEEALKCYEFCPSRNATYCTQNIPKYFQCSNQKTLEKPIRSQAEKKLANIFKYISYSIPPIMFLLSIICTIFLFTKIASQLHFQLKNNRESFKQTIKISSVVGFQCLTMAVIFLITSIQKFLQVKSIIFNTTLFYDDLPTWLLLLQYYTTTASLNMIRVLLDSFIILTVLTGYSKCVILIVKSLWLCFTSPKLAFKKIKHSVKGSSSAKVTIIRAS